MIARRVDDVEVYNLLSSVCQQNSVASNWTAVVRTIRRSKVGGTPIIIIIIIYLYQTMIYLLLRVMG